MGDACCKRVLETLRSTGSVVQGGARSVWASCSRRRDASAGDKLLQRDGDVEMSESISGAGLAINTTSSASSKTTGGLVGLTPTEQIRIARSISSPRPSPRGPSNEGAAALPSISPTPTYKGPDNGEAPLSASLSLPGQRVEMTFAEVAPGSPFAATYERAPKDNFIFLVAGDELLFVGGGALNGAVGQLLLQDAGQKIAFEVDESGGIVKQRDPATGRDVPKYDEEDCLYAKMHMDLFMKAREQPRKLTVATAEDIGDADVNVSFAAARCWHESDWPFGAMFLDIFKADKRPFGCAENVGLIYTAGPLGRNQRAEGEADAEAAREGLVRKDAQDFVHDLFWTGANCIETIAEFNMSCSSSSSSSDKPPRVNIVRLPVVSGGTFIHPEVSVTEAALALLWGLSQGLSSSPASSHPRIELMPEEAMKEAYRMFYVERAVPSQWNTQENRYLFCKLEFVEPKFSPIGLDFEVES